MGVMGCSRGCGNILVDTYVDSCGYVCYDCQKEFKTYLKIEGIVPRTKGEVKEALNKFLETDAGDQEDYVENSIDIDQFFQDYTK